MGETRWVLGRGLWVKSDALRVIGEPRWVMDRGLWVMIIG